MEERRITVKKGECPLDHLAELVKQRHTAWVFINKPVADTLISQAGYKTVIGTKRLIGMKQSLGAKRNADICLLETKVNGQDGWSEILEVSAPDIEFKTERGIPGIVLLLTMEE